MDTITATTGKSNPISPYATKSCHCDANCVYSTVRLRGTFWIVLVLWWYLWAMRTQRNGSCLRAAVSNATDRRSRCTDEAGLFDCVAQLVSLCPSTPELHSAAILLAGGTNNSLLLVCRVAQQHSAPRRLQIVLPFIQSKKGQKHHTHAHRGCSYSPVSVMAAGRLSAGRLSAG